MSGDLDFDDDDDNDEGVHDDEYYDECNHMSTATKMRRDIAPDDDADDDDGDDINDKKIVKPFTDWFRVFVLCVGWAGGSGHFCLCPHSLSTQTPTP